MMKKSRKTNWRIKIEPVYPRWTRDEDRIERIMEQTCNEIKEAVKRHVDDVDDVIIKYDLEHECSECGWQWTEDSDTYNGGCCAADEQNNPNTPTTSVQASEPGGESK